MFMSHEILQSSYETLQWAGQEVALKKHCALIIERGGLPRTSPPPSPSSAVICTNAAALST